MSSELRAPDAAAATRMLLVPLLFAAASCNCGHRKPSREFFNCLIARSPCPASSLCFIDDLPANIAGARKAGIGHTIEFAGNIDQLRARLSALDIAA